MLFLVIFLVLFDPCLINLFLHFFNGKYKKKISNQAINQYLLQDYQPLPTEEPLSTEEPEATIYQVDPDGDSQLYPKIDGCP